MQLSYGNTVNWSFTEQLAMKMTHNEGMCIYIVKLGHAQMNGIKFSLVALYARGTAFRTHSNNSYFGCWRALALMPVQRLFL